LARANSEKCSDVTKSHPTDRTPHAEALRNLERGWTSLPLREGGKEPHFEALRYTHGSTSQNVLLGRPATREQIDAWYARHPNAGVGVMLEGSRLIVLDFDSGAVPTQMLGSGPLVQTGRPGLHIYRAVTGDVSLRGLGKRGYLDVKTSGYVAQPPSVHPSGKSYAWLRSPEESGVPALEEGLLLDALWERIRERREKCTTPPQDTPDTQSVNRLGITPSDLGEVDGVEKFVRAVCDRLSIPFGRKFRCVLPGHEERHPSAALWRAGNGRWRYKDFHRSTRTWSLVEVYASTLSGEPVERVAEWGAPSLAHWKRRLMVETGFLEPVSVVLPTLPTGASACCSRVYEAVREIFSVRWSQEPGAPAPLTREFLARWARVSVPTAERAKGELIRNKIIVPDEMAGRTRLWLPGGRADDA
jgi:hypothetical protein